MKLPESFFASPNAIPKNVKLSDGSEHLLHFRELPAIEFRRYRDAERSDDENTRIEAMARLIAASLVDEAGRPAITLVDAKRLKAAPMSAMWQAILEVNSATPEAAAVEGNA